MTTKLGKNQYLRPSGIVASNNGKYFYWNCTISGTATFANDKRFAKVVAQYGSEEKLFKTFICRDVKKLQMAGFTNEQIKKSVADGKNLVNELPAEVKVKKVKEKKVKKVSEDPEVMQEFLNTVPEVVQPKEKERVIYPWSNDPSYFSCPPSPLDIGETTTDSCMFSNRYLDSECQGCSVYAQCKCPIKYTEEDWKSGKKKREQPIKKAIRFNEAGEAV